MHDYVIIKKDFTGQGIELGSEDSEIIRNAIGKKIKKQNLNPKPPMKAGQDQEKPSMKRIFGYSKGGRRTGI